MNSILQSGLSLPPELLPMLAHEQYLPALELLRRSLTQLRAEATVEDWRAFCPHIFASERFGQHPLSLLLKLGPLGSGGAGTARGLMHEPLVLDVIYGIADPAPAPTAAAHVLRPWELALGFCASLRARRLLFIRELQELGNLVAHPRILAVGCGHLRDAPAALALEKMQGGELVAFDRDRACIDLIKRQYRYPGLRPVSGSLRSLANDPALGQFDLIYLPTLFDTLGDARVSTLLEMLLPLLKPGGRLLAANFSSDVGDAAYLEACLDWWPSYRAEDSWATLLSRLSSQNLRGQAIYRDDSGGSVFLDLQAV